MRAKKSNKKIHVGRPETVIVTRIVVKLCNFNLIFIISVFSIFWFIHVVGQSPLNNCRHRHTGRHFTDRTAKICPENKNLP